MCRRRFRLSRRPGVINCAVAQLLHHLLKVRREVAVGGDAIGRSERPQFASTAARTGSAASRGLSHADRSRPETAAPGCASANTQSVGRRPRSPRHPRTQRLSPRPSWRRTSCPDAVDHSPATASCPAWPDDVPHNHDPTGSLRRHRRWWFSVWTGLGLLRRQWDGTCCIGRRLSR